MCKRVSLILIVLFCFFGLSGAQDSVCFKPQHLFSISTGITNNIIKDDAISPDIYSGIQAPVYLNYWYIGIKSRQSFSIYFDKTKLKSVIPRLSSVLTHYTDDINVVLDYSYNFKLYSLPKYKVQCFIGGKFKSLLNYREHYYLNTGEEYMIEQFNSIDLNLILEKRFAKNSDLLYFNLNFPIITYSLFNNIYNSKVSSSEELLIDNPNIEVWQILKNGEFITFNKLVEFQTEFSYTKILSRHVGLELKYRVHFYSFAQYKNLLYSKYLSAQYLVGFMIKI